MYETLHRTRKIKGIEVDAWGRLLDDASALSVEVGTTGEKEDGKKKAALSFIRFKNVFGTNMEVCEILDDKDKTQGVELVFRGDAELLNLIKALKFAYKTLKKENRNRIPAFLD